MNLADMFVAHIMSCQVFWTIITFGIMFLYMKFFFVPKAEYSITERAKYIYTMNQELQTIKNEIYKIETDYIEQSEDLDRLIKDRVEQLHLKYNALLDKARKQIEVDVLKKKADLQSHLHKYAAEIEKSFIKYADNIIKEYNIHYVD